MKKVYESLNTMMVGHLKNLLMIEGIPSFTKNEYGSAERISVNECWYEIWIENDTQYDEAEKIIKEALSDDSVSGPDWICPNCQEVNEYQFSLCWNCGKENPNT